MSGGNVYSNERDLYAPIQTWIESPSSVTSPTNCDYSFQITADTSTLNWSDDELGSWMRPDLTQLRITRPSYGAQTESSLCAFEVKKTVSSLVEPLFQALSYTEISEYSFLIAPSSSDWTPRIVRTAERFGVGLVKFDDVQDWSTFQTIASAKKFEPDPNLRKNYLDATFGDSHSQSKIRNALKGGL